MQKFNSRLLEHIGPYDHVIWDLNGTIVNDFPQGVAALGTLMLECNLEPITPERYRQEFCFPIKDLYIKLGFDFSKYPFEDLCVRYQEIWDVLQYKAELHGGIRDFLEQVSQQKTQSVLSAGIQWHVEQTTKHFEIHHLFDHVFGINDLQAASKLGRGRELIKKSEIAPEKTILIGDTNHDFEVSQNLGTACLLIADGYQSHERLSTIHKHVIHSRYK